METHTLPWVAQGARLREARLRAGLSQEQLAAEVGSDRHHLITLEKGWYRPRRELLARIAERTGTPFASFGYEYEDDRPIEAQVREARRFLADLERRAKRTGKKARAA